MVIETEDVNLPAFLSAEAGSIITALLQKDPLNRLGANGLAEIQGACQCLSFGFSLHFTAVPFPSLSRVPDSAFRLALHCISLSFLVPSLSRVPDSAVRSAFHCISLPFLNTSLPPHCLPGHPFFSSIDWPALLRKELTPPFVPGTTAHCLSRVCYDCLSPLTRVRFIAAGTSTLGNFDPKILKMPVNDGKSLPPTHTHAHAHTHTHTQPFPPTHTRTHTHTPWPAWVALAILLSGDSRTIPKPKLATPRLCLSIPGQAPHTHTVVNTQSWALRL